MKLQAGDKTRIVDESHNNKYFLFESTELYIHRLKIYFCTRSMYLMSNYENQRNFSVIAFHLLPTLNDKYVTGVSHFC